MIARRAVAALVALLLLAPVSSATWRILGSTEPDTPEDRTGLMFLEPDRTPGEGLQLVYFNAVAKQGNSAVTTGRVNPNLAPESRLAPVGSFEATAYLGVWKDCNGDGYVGAAMSAWWEYPSALLPSDDICPEGSSFHADKWVREFHWIIPRHHDIVIGPEPIYLREPFVIMDPAVGVWGDFGRPGQPLDAPPCDPTAAPRGTTARTGGLLAHADCASQRRVSAAATAADDAAGTGLWFEDPQHPERDCDHALNRPVGLYHDANRCPGDRDGILMPGAGSAITVMDCARTEENAVKNPEALAGVTGDTNGNLLYLPTLAPRVAEDPTAASLNDTYAATWTPVVSCPMPMVPYAWVAALAIYVGSHPERIGAGEWLITQNVEKSDSSTGAPTKRATDLTFTFGWGAVRRGSPSFYNPIIERYAPGIPDTLYGIVGDMPGYGGLSATMDSGGGYWPFDEDFPAGGWQSKGLNRGPPSYTGLVRGDASPQGAFHVTYYAKVGAATIAIAQVPGSGVYASERCAVGADRGGWSCDATEWWNPAAGAPPVPPQTYGARAGESYQLRDVDCHDGTVLGGVPVTGVASVALGETCAGG